jgi:hypothetical protein
MKNKRKMKKKKKNQLKAKGCWRYAQEIECLPSKRKALSLNPSIAPLPKKSSEIQ